MALQIDVCTWPGSSAFSSMYIPRPGKAGIANIQRYPATKRRILTLDIGVVLCLQSMMTHRRRGNPRPIAAMRACLLLSRVKLASPPGNRRDFIAGSLRSQVGVSDMEAAKREVCRVGDGPPATCMRLHRAGLSK